MAMFTEIAMSKFGTELFFGIVQGGCGVHLAIGLEENNDGPLQKHLEAMRQALKIEKPLSLLIADKSFANLTSFGNTCLPGKAGIILSKSLLDEEIFSENEIKFFITREVVHLAQNDMKWQFLSPIIGISMYVFLHPVAAIATSYILQNYLIQPWIEENADRIALEISSQEIRVAVLGFFERLKRVEEESSGLNNLRIRNCMSQLPPIEWRIHLAKKHLDLNLPNDERFKTA